MNWGPTSALENREVGLLIEGDGPAVKPLRDSFLLDWGMTLSDELALRKDGLTVERPNSTWTRVSLAVTPTRVARSDIVLYLSTDKADGFLGPDAVGRGTARVGISQGNATVVEFIGHLPPTGGRLFLFAHDGERACLIMTLNVTLAGSVENGDWDSPLYKDPLFPLALMIILPVAIAVPIALYRWRRDLPEFPEE
jgi:hypothetical protein